MRIFSPIDRSGSVFQQNLERQIHVLAEIQLRHHMAEAMAGAEGDRAVSPCRTPACRSAVRRRARVDLHMERAALRQTELRSDRHRIRPRTKRQIPRADAVDQARSADVAVEREKRCQLLIEAEAHAEIIAGGVRRVPRDVEADPRGNARRDRVGAEVEHGHFAANVEVADARPAAFVTIYGDAIASDQSAQRRRRRPTSPQLVAGRLVARHRRPERLEAADQTVEHPGVALMQLHLAAELEARHAAQREPAAIVERERMCLVALADQELVVLFAIEVVGGHRVNRQAIRSVRRDIAVFTRHDVAAPAATGLIDRQGAQRRPPTGEILCRDRMSQRQYDDHPQASNRQG